MVVTARPSMIPAHLSCRQHHQRCHCHHIPSRPTSRSYLSMPRRSVKKSTAAPVAEITEAEVMALWQEAGGNALADATAAGTMAEAFNALIGHRSLGGRTRPPLCLSMLMYPARRWCSEIARGGDRRRCQCWRHGRGAGGPAAVDMPPGRSIARRPAPVARHPRFNRREQAAVGRLRGGGMACRGRGRGAA